MDALNFDIDAIYRDLKTWFLKNNIRAHLPKTNEPTTEGDEVVDFDELFENFNRKEFEECFKKQNPIFYRTMVCCFVFFMSNYAWNKKIYLSTPNIRYSFMGNLANYLKLPQNHNIFYETKPIDECLQFTPETNKYTGKYADIFYKPFAIQIEECFNEENIVKRPGIRGTNFSYLLGGVEYEIVCLDEPIVYLENTSIRFRTGLSLNEFIYLRQEHPKIVGNKEWLKQVHIDRLDDLGPAFF